MPKGVKGFQKGRQKTGGRTPGVANKLTGTAKDMIMKWLDAHNTIPEGDATAMIMQDFMSIKPAERVKVTAEFIKIIMPRDVRLVDSGIHLTIEDRLINLAKEEEVD